MGGDDAIDPVGFVLPQIVGYAEEINRMIRPEPYDYRFVRKQNTCGNGRVKLTHLGAKWSRKSDPP
jgi:hypothetical protein